jgi:hypothetical protein
LRWKLGSLSNFRIRSSTTCKTILACSAPNHGTLP